jgi:hypothetical protein
VLLYNRLADTPQDRTRSQAFFTDVFRVAFPAAYCLDVGGNLMLVSEAAAVNKA